MGGGFIGLPPIVDCEYDRAGTPGHACTGCNSAWPASEGDSEPFHHATACPWFKVLEDRARPIAFTHPNGSRVEPRR